MSKFRSGGAVKDRTYSSSGSKTESEEDDTRTNGQSLSSLSGKNRKNSPYKNAAHVQSLN